MDSPFNADSAALEPALEIINNQVRHNRRRTRRTDIPAPNGRPSSTPTVITRTSTGGTHTENALCVSWRMPSLALCASDRPRVGVATEGDGVRGSLGVHCVCLGATGEHEDVPGDAVRVRPTYSGRALRYTMSQRSSTTRDEGHLRRPDADQRVATKIHSASPRCVIC